MSGGDVPLELLVPRRSVELRKPVAEGQKLLAGELADGGFDLVDGAHVGTVNQAGFRARASFSFAGRAAKSAVSSPCRFTVTKQSFADRRVTKLELGHEGNCGAEDELTGGSLACGNLARSTVPHYSPPMPATLNMEIPADVLESARMTVGDAKVELAIALFASGRLSLGKAAELAGVPVGQFQMHLGARHIGPHYDAGDAREDRETLSALRPA